MIWGLIVLAAVLVFLDRFGPVYVRGHSRKNGSYVRPHFRSRPTRWPW